MPRAPPQGNKRPVPAAAMERESKRSRDSPPLLWDPVAIPMPLASALQRWGPELRQEMEVAARKEPGLAAPCVSAGAYSLRVATDCSGLEAPLLALKAMQVPFRHVFSSEIDPQKRDFINLNFPDAVLYDDMVRRDQSLVPPHDLYVCGFPCKPFSSLHHGSQFFKEAQARPFFAAIKTIAACLPAVAILENVPGIQRVMPQVLRHLRKLAWYRVIVIHDNPLSMGEPVDRPRIFFVLLRADVVKDNVQRLAAQLVSAGCCETARAAVRDRCLPNDSPAVSCRRNAGTFALAPPQRKASSSAPPKWEKQHQGLPLAPKVPVLSPLTSREESLLRVLLARSGLSDLRPDFNVDLSQGLGRAHVRAHCPTITPGGKVLVGGLRRVLGHWDKCLLHLVPVHRLQWPRSLSEQKIGDLAGNTMHLMSAGPLVQLFFVHGCACICVVSLPTRHSMSPTDGFDSEVLLSLGRVLFSCGAQCYV